MPDLPTYYRLHAAMEAEVNFKRVITGANDFKQYRMPLGTYWTDAFDDGWEAFNAAQRAALPIDATAQVILCGTGPILFQNCRQYVEQPILGLHSIRPTEPQRPAPKPRTVPLGEPAMVAGPHNPGQTQTHRPAPRLPYVPDGEPTVAGLHRIPPAEAQRPEAKWPRIARGEPSVAALQSIPQTPTHRPVAKSPQVLQTEPSPGPHSAAYGDPYGTPPAPTQVPRGKQSLAGLHQPV